MVRNAVLIAIAIVVLVAGSFYLYNRFFPVGEEQALPELERGKRPVPPPADAGAPPPPPPLELPELDTSDETLRRLVTELSSHPRLAAWLVHEDLARLFVRVVDNVALGESPYPNLKFMAPEGAFAAEKIGERTLLSEASARRYDLVTTVVTSLDTEGSVRLYRALHPLFEEAYAELGNPDRFADALARALDRVLAVPVPEEQIELRHRITSYRFADPRLEELGPVEKHLLRMGRRNTREIQAKLRAIRTALALTRLDTPD